MTSWVSPRGTKAFLPYPRRGREEPAAKEEPPKKKVPELKAVSMPKIPKKAGTQASGTKESKKLYDLARAWLSVVSGSKGAGRREIRAKEHKALVTL